MSKILARNARPHFTAEKRKKKTARKKNSVADERIASITFEPGRKFNGFVIAEKIGEGGFGRVYRCKNIEDGNEVVALKAEAHVEASGCAIKIERKVLNLIQSRAYAHHLPMCYNAAKRKNFSYMIMTLVGKSLKDVQKGMGKKNKGEYNNLHLSTWIRIGIQALYGLKTLHDNGFIHRDVKPANFALGVDTDPEKATIVHVLDFGLARNYCYPIDDGEKRSNNEVPSGVPTRWRCRIARSKVNFRGTAKYCSPNAHDHVEQGRGDDIWSMMYMLVEFNSGLPWNGAKGLPAIKRKKCFYDDIDLMINMPRELADIVPNLRKLDCYARPDYQDIHRRFVEVMRRHDIGYEDRYDWEPKEKELIRPRLLPEWYDAEEFFTFDPIGDLDPGHAKKEDGDSKSTNNTTDETRGGSKEVV